MKTSILFSALLLLLMFISSCSVYKEPCEGVSSNHYESSII